MTILVTGGLGFIGSHTVVSLIENGYKVVIADNLSNSQLDVLERLKKITGQNIPFYQIDVCNETLVNNIFQENNLEGVIHFAGFKAVGESVKNPLKYYKNNILSTITIANACQNHNVNKLVFSSSATVYGDNKAPFDETMELKPTTNPYGESKAICERILKDFSESNSNIQISILRYFNPVGAHKSGLLGEEPNGIPNNLMPYINKVANGEINKLKIFGNDYPTKDGTGIRDFIHVLDLAEGHLAALKSNNEGLSIYNLGTGLGTSVKELVTVYEDVNNIVIPYEISQRRQGDLAECYANVQKAQVELKWVAKLSLKDMCRDSWRFIKNKKV